MTRDQELAQLPIEDQCLVHRLLYYVHSRPVLTDHEYDMLERDATAQASDSHAIQRPGSDLLASYPPRLQELAKRFLT